MLFHRSRCLRHLALHDFINYFVWANYKYYRELRFSPWLKSIHHLVFIMCHHTMNFRLYPLPVIDPSAVMHKSKLTVTSDSRLDSWNFWESSKCHESQESSFEFQISSREIVWTCCENALFKIKNYHSVHWVRLVHFSINKACALKVKMFAYGLLLIVLLKLSFNF